MGYVGAMTKWAGRLQAVVISVLGIIAGIPSMFLVPLPLTVLFTKRYQREERIQRWHFICGWARFCLRYLIGTKVHVVGREHIPKDRRGHLYICNHQSIVDIVVLIDALSTVAFLAKNMVKWVPIAGPCAYAAGSIFVKRGDGSSHRKALKETLRMCRESTAVVIFPEGTRSSDGEIRSQIYPGTIRFAHRLGIKIIPVGLDGTAEVVPKSHDRVVRKQPIAVHIGKPMDPADYPDAKSWVDATWDKVRELFEQSRDYVETARATHARQSG